MFALLLAASAAAADVPADAKLDIDAAPFPHPSVSATMDALLDNREAEITSKAGWTHVDVVEDGRPVHWAFTPDSHPAHPSVVRRTPVEKDGEVRVLMAYRCEAARPACDQLVAEMTKQNAGMVEKFKERLGLLKHPREAEAVALAEQFLAMVDDGRDAESIELLTTYSRTGYTIAEWRRVMDENRRKLGKLQERRLSRVAPFENPPDVPLAGTFMFMEFEAIYEHQPRAVQYLVLHSAKGAPFRVMHDEATTLRFRRVRRP